MILKNGNRGEAVTQVQRALRDLGYDISVDGVFGDETETVVMEFQSDHSLAVDGKVGPDTQFALGLDSTNQSEAREMGELSWDFTPLPSTLESELRIAVDRFVKALKIDPSIGAEGDASSVQTSRILCQLDNLLNEMVDDRQIRYNHMCTSLPRQASIVPGSLPCDPEKERRLINYGIRTPSDVHLAPDSLRLVTYLKKTVVNLHSTFSQDADAIAQLRWVDVTVEKAITFLHNLSVADELIRSMPDHYRAIFGWVEERQTDSNSVYSCR